MEPVTLSRCINLTASWIRKNGARALTCMMRSYPSGEVSQMVPRSVTAATLTSTCRVPNASSAAAITRRQLASSCRSPATKRARQPAASNSATIAWPRCSSRPLSTTPAAPRAANRRAVAAPQPLAAPGDDRVLAGERAVLHVCPARSGTPGLRMVTVT